MEFEKKLQQLEETASKLENKEISLEEGVRLFELGLTLTKECLKSLGDQKDKIAKVRVEMESLSSEE
jgi:exodeoxyribonuclease VII small subunit